MHYCRQVADHLHSAQFCGCLLTPVSPPCLVLPLQQHGSFPLPFQSPTCVSLGYQAVEQFVWEGSNKGFPVRAPPVLQKGDFVLCGTNVSQQDQGGGSPLGRTLCSAWVP
jgi:hypothetical protein